MTGLALEEVAAALLRGLTLREIIAGAAHRLAGTEPGEWMEALLADEMRLRALEQEVLRGTSRIDAGSLSRE